MDFMKEKGSPRKILVCQQRQIGDVLLATPCVRLLAEKFPQAELHFITEKKCSQVLVNNPHLAKVWEIDTKAGLVDRISLYRKIRKERFDLVVDFQQLPRLRMVTLMSGAKHRLSYPPKWYNRPLYNLTGELLKGYAAKAKSGVLSPLGIVWDGEMPEMFLSDAERHWAANHLAEEGIPLGGAFVTFDPTHRHEARKWPVEHYAKLINMFLDETPDVYSYLLYGPGEKNDVDKVRQLVGHADRCIVPGKVTTLREMAAVIEKAVGQVGNCSSPRHFAAAVGTPTITIHGSTKPGAWTYPGPEHQAIRDESLECLGCNSSKCKDGATHCMMNVSPEAVYALAKTTFSYHFK